MSEPTNWKKLLLENWIPAMTPAVFAFLGVVILGPKIHEDYLKRDNFNTDTKEFYNRFVQNFGNLRAAGRELMLACESKNQSAEMIWKAKFQTAYDKLWAESFDISTFFGEETYTRIFSFLRKYYNSTPTCSTIKKNTEVLMQTEAELVPAMKNLIYNR